MNTSPRMSRESGDLIKQVTLNIDQVIKSIKNRATAELKARETAEAQKEKAQRAAEKAIERKIQLRLARARRGLSRLLEIAKNEQFRQMLDSCNTAEKLKYGGICIFLAIRDTGDAWYQSPAQVCERSMGDFYREGVVICDSHILVIVEEHFQFKERYVVGLENPSVLEVEHLEVADYDNSATSLESEAFLREFARPDPVDLRLATDNNQRTQQWELCSAVFQFLTSCNDRRFFECNLIRALNRLE